LAARTSTGSMTCGCPQLGPVKGAPCPRPCAARSRPPGGPPSPYGPRVPRYLLVPAARRPGHRHRDAASEGVEPARMRGCGPASLDRWSCQSRAGSGSDPPRNPAEMADSLGFVTVNRTQSLVLGFFLVVWVSLLVILAAAPEVFDQALRLPPHHRVVELAVLAALSGLIGFLAIGVVRRWRWTFWLILVAFLFGVLRVPAAVLQFTGILATNTPTWYVTFQALLGVVQF